jgi:hypothetical protein
MDNVSINLFEPANALFDVIRRFSLILTSSADYSSLSGKEYKPKSKNLPGAKIKSLKLLRPNSPTVCGLMLMFTLQTTGKIKIVRCGETMKAHYTVVTRRIKSATTRNRRTGEKPPEYQFE